MSPVSITLTFLSYAAAVEALSRLAAEAGTAVISHADRPDVGVAIAPPAPVNPFATVNAVFVPVPPVPTEAAVVPAAPTAGVPPVPPAPILPTAAIGLPGAPVLDSKGLPWDGRIHGATQTKNADGSWRQKRGLNDEAMKNRVEAELRAGQAARLLVAPAAPVSAPVPPAITAQSPVASPAPVSPPTEPVAGETAGQLMARLAPILQSNPAAAPKVAQALGMFGLTGIGQILNAPELIGPFAAAFDALMATGATT